MIMDKLDDKREIWERLPGESIKAYRCFCIYRDLGVDRSINKVQKALRDEGKKYSLTLLLRWSKRFNWVSRAEAYDEYLERLRRLERERLIKEMVERHTKLAIGFQQRVAERLMMLDPNELGPSDLIKWFEIAAKIERLSVGEPTVIERGDGVPKVVEIVIKDDEEENKKR